MRPKLSEPGPDWEASTRKYYSENVSDFCEQTVLLPMHEAYQLFLPHLSAGARILDLGCGSGRDSKFFVENGFDVVSWDPNPEVAEWASSYLSKVVDVKGVFGGFFKKALQGHLQ